MDDKLKKLKLDLYLKELKFLDSEQDFYDEFITHYKPIFMDELTKNGYQPQITTGETIQDNIQTTQKKSFEVKDDESKIIKSTFRSIAKLSHPDKTKNIYRNKLYEQAQIAYETNDLLTLYKIAKRLNIEIELTVSTVLLLEKIVDDKKKEMGGIKTSFLWLWVNAQTEEEKQEVINKFLNKHGK